MMKERLHSSTNQILWTLRELLKFKRSGYTESEGAPAQLVGEALRLDQKFAFSKSRPFLSAFNGARNLATLSYLEQMLDDFELKSEMELLEPGCQDFVRLPAWRAYFRQRQIKLRVRGIEVDAFPILRDLHSRWDKAQYYLSLEKEGSDYLATDFFKYSQPADAVIVFYPFVSKAPALAWGLPEHFASAELWLKSLDQVLSSQGWALLVHQGEWEEKDFDEARAKIQWPFRLHKRKVLDCSFFKTAHPAHASLYVKN